MAQLMAIPPGILTNEFFTYLFWGGERRHKVTLVNACKQVKYWPSDKNLDISSNRLDRVKKAQSNYRQIKLCFAFAQMGAVDSPAAASGVVTEVEVQVDEAVIEN